MSAVLTAAITVIVGVVVFVLGQLAQKLLIEPIQEQKRTIGKVTHALTYYRNVGPDAPDGSESRTAEARGLYRDLAAELRMNLRVPSPLPAFSWLRLVLPKEQVRRATGALIGLSRTVQKRTEAGPRLRYHDEVKRCLKIER